MLKSLFYHFIRNYLKLYGYIYFRDIKIYGRENIPKNGGLEKPPISPWSPPVMSTRARIIL